MKETSNRIGSIDAYRRLFVLVEEANRESVEVWETDFILDCSAMIIDMIPDFVFSYGAVGYDR